MGFARSLVQKIILAGVVARSVSVRAALYTDASQLPTDTFDFVVIGGTLSIMFPECPQLTLRQVARREM